MIVCVCKAVNDRAIRRAVAEGHDSFDALQFELGIGTCCGRCVAAACEVLCDARLGTTGGANVGTIAQPVRLQRTPSRPTVEAMQAGREAALA